MQRIIVVDNEPDICEMIAEMLNFQYQVDTFQDVDDALSFYRKNEVDLIITDLFMPNKTGLDLLESFKKDEIKTKQKPQLLAMSGGSRVTKSDFLPLAKVFGANDTLQKPFTMSELKNKVAALLN